ncbi:hypothetical protein ACFE04_011506 [Oxalis oulophora]
MKFLKSVVSLTQWDFGDAVRSHQFLAYEAAALYFTRNNYTSINLAIVDVSDEVNKCLAITYNTSMSRYSNIERLAAPIPAQINTIKEVNDLDKIAIVGIFPVFSGLEYDKFVQANETLKWKYDICKHHGSRPVVRVYNLFVNKEHIVETQDFNASLVEFVEDASPEVVTLYNKHRSEFVYNFFNTRIKTDKVVLLIKSEDTDAHAFTSKYRLVAKKYKYLGVHFMMEILRIARKHYWLCLGFRVSKIPSTPIIVIRNDNHLGKEKIYAKFDLTLNYDIDGWLRDYKLGRVAKYGKSEPIPQENDELVEVIVADNFDEQVMKSGKNVLLALHRSTRGDWAQILNEAAIQIGKADDVRIAKLDESANDIRSTFPGDLKTLEGAPTLYFISTRGKIKLYKHSFDKDHIVEFVMH